MLPATLNHHEEVLFHWHFIRLLEQPRMYKYYVNAPPCYVTRPVHRLYYHTEYMQGQC